MYGFYEYELFRIYRWYWIIELWSFGREEVYCDFFKGFIIDKKIFCVDKMLSNNKFLGCG